MKKSILIFLINLIIVLGVQAQWKKIDPPKGFGKTNIKKLIYYKGSYFISTYDGLFKLNEKLDSINLVDTSEKFKSITDLAIVKSNLFISTLDGYLYSTLDSGKSFYQTIKLSRFLELIPYFNRLYAFNPVSIFYLDSTGENYGQDPGLSSITSKNLPIDVVNFDNHLIAFLDKSIIVKNSLKDKWKLSGKSNIFISKVVASNKKLFCIGGNDDSLYESSDSGRYWQKINIKFAVSTFYADSQIVLIGGNNGQIIYSNHIFQSQNSFKDSLIGVDVNGFYHSNNKIFAFGPNGNLYYRNIDTITVSINKTEYNIRDFKVEIYPNPSNSGIFQIKSNNPNIEFNVYTLEGKLVNYLKSINNESKLDLTHLSSGYYLLRIYNPINKSFQNEKIIINK